MQWHKDGHYTNNSKQSCFGGSWLLGRHSAQVLSFPLCQVHLGSAGVTAWWEEGKKSWLEESYHWWCSWEWSPRHWNNEQIKGLPVAPPPDNEKPPSALILLHIHFLSTPGNKMIVWSLLSILHIQLQLFYCNLII